MTDQGSQLTPHTPPPLLVILCVMINVLVTRERQIVVYMLLLSSFYPSHVFFAPQKLRQVGSGSLKSYSLSETDTLPPEGVRNKLFVEPTAVCLPECCVVGDS